MQTRAAFYRTIAWIFALCLALFAGLAWQVHSGGPLVALDQRVAESLHASAVPWGVSTLKFVTFFGEFTALTALAVIGAAVLLRVRAHGLALGWVLSMIGTAVLNGLLKRGFARERPSFVDPIITASGFSFPSGHSMGTMVAVTMLAYAAFRLTPSRRIWRRATVGLAVSWTLIMGFSRMYLGVHYLSDVVAGLAAGGAWACICMALLEYARQRPAKAQLGR
jgi:membrane-associated phospholipid phosphatase